MCSLCVCFLQESLFHIKCTVSLIFFCVCLLFYRQGSVVVSYQANFNSSMSAKAPAVQQTFLDGLVNGTKLGKYTIDVDSVRHEGSSHFFKKNLQYFYSHQTKHNCPLWQGYLSIWLMSHYRFYVKQAFSYLGNTVCKKVLVSSKPSRDSFCIRNVKFVRDTVKQTVPLRTQLLKLHMCNLKYNVSTQGR